jgi:hypothetical protein
MNEQNETKAEAYEGWAIIELMGHRRYAGKVREAAQYGVSMLRIDVPEDDDLSKYSTHFYGGSSLYGVHPTNEATARALAKRSKPEPVQQWELPKLAAGKAVDVEDAQTEEELDDDDHDEAF